MSDATDPTAAPEGAAPTAPKPDNRRAWWGRAALAVFVIVGVLLFQTTDTVDALVVFSLPATMGEGDAAFSRDEARSVDVRVIDEDGQVRVRSTLDFGELAAGTRTPAISIAMPEGDYLVQATVRSVAGGRANVSGDLRLAAKTPRHVVRLR